MTRFNRLNVPNQFQHYWTKHPEGYTLIEALLNWVAQVDNMVDNQNGLNKTVEDYRKELDSFINQFDGELQKTVTETLSEWQESGFLDIVISQALQTQIDTVAEQLAQIAQNVLKFGAVGDGVTDDTQAFVKANSNGGVLLVPSGYTFVVDNLTLNNVTLVGGGTLKRKSNSTTKMLHFKGSFKVENIKFNGNRLNQDDVNRPSITMEDAPYSSFDGCSFTDFKSKLILTDVASSPHGRIVNCDFFNTTFLTSGDVISLRSSNWLVSGCSFKGIGNGHCIRVGLLNGDGTTPVTDVRIESCTFAETEHNAITLEIYSQRVLIRGNTFKNNPQAIKTESSGDTVFDVIIEGNIFKDISLSTALNLSATKISFINNKCSNMAGPYFGEHFKCSDNDFFDCGTPTNPVIGTSGTVYNAFISNNLIVNAKYRAITPTGGIITGNKIINSADMGIRVTSNAVISGNYVDGATSGIVLASTAVNCAVTGNVVLNTTGSKIANASSATSVIVGNNVA